MSNGNRSLDDGSIPSLSQLSRWRPSNEVLIAWSVLWLVVIFAYRDSLQHLMKVWYNQPEYGHGFFVLPFSLFLLWYRQDMVNPWPSKIMLWEIIVGLACLAAWVVARVIIFAGQYDIDDYTLFPLVIGLTLLLGGVRALWWAWPSIFFLFFMLPLPASISASVAQPLQRVATVMTVYTLQTVGVPAYTHDPESTVINLSEGHTPLEVARACSGLSMLTLFFAICVGASFVSKVIWPEIRWWEKILLVVSAVPIAVLSNVARISITGMLKEWIADNVGQEFHDRLGWTMMIVAMLLIWGEMSLLSNLFINNSREGPLSFNQQKSQVSRKRSRPQLL